MNRVSDLFDVCYGTNLEYNKMIPQSNGIPFVARGSGNNGVVGYVKRIEGDNPNPQNTISVAGGGSVLESYLQERPYYSGRDLYYLRPKKVLSNNQLLFYCLVLRSNKYRFSYGRQANRTLGHLMIPSLDEIPNWVEKTNIPEKPNRGSVISNGIKLAVENWKWFAYDELFTIERGKGAREEDLVTNGRINFITSIDSNNGLTGYVNNPPKHKPHVITVNRNGSVAEAFYQTEPFCSTEDVHVFTPKFKMNQYIALFLVTLIKLEKYRYSYGRKWGLDRMRSSTIKLPDSNGQPDWQFMEDYIKSLPYSSNLKEISESKQKKVNSLTDSELIEKYESGSIDFGKTLEPTLKNED